jgi:hypothetical protein
VGQLHYSEELLADLLHEPEMNLSSVRDGGDGI